MHARGPDTWRVGPTLGAWVRWYARGTDTSRVDPLIRAWAAPPRRISRGWRACRGANVHVQRFMCERHTRPGAVASTTQTTSPTTPRCRRLLPRWFATWAAPPRGALSPTASVGIALHGDPCVTCLPMTAPPDGGNCTIRGATRRRHAEGRLLMLQNPHHYPWPGLAWFCGPGVLRVVGCY